jgi:hypothetical protein
VTAKCYEFTSRPGVAGLQQQIETLLSFQGCIHPSLILNGGTIFMRLYKHWLDHDVAALAFLIVGMTAVELLAMII